MSQAPVLVTGAAGFVGSWLMPLLEQRGGGVVGVHQPGTPPATFGDRWVDVDLRDRGATERLVRDVSPDRILHMAAIAYPPAAERDPLEAMRVNYGALDALLSGMAAHAPQARFLFVGTGQCYALRPIDEPPVSEDEALRPSSTYAATKVAADERCRLAHARDGLAVMRARPMNHTGPGRPADYAESSFAWQLARIEHGLQEPVVHVGNLDAIVDLSDVRDVVEAYTVVLTRGEPGAAYNVASGRAIRLREVLDILVSLSKVTPRIEVDPELYRALEGGPRARILDTTRLRALGWDPRYSLEETLADLLDDWRSSLGAA